jgi:hypothetical protein
MRTYLKNNFHFVVLVLKYWEGEILLVNTVGNERAISLCKFKIVIISTAKKTQCISVTKISWLVLVRKIIAV